MPIASAVARAARITLVAASLLLGVPATRALAQTLPPPAPASADTIRAASEGRAAAAAHGGWTGRGFAAGMSLSLFGTGLVYGLAPGSEVQLPAAWRQAIAAEPPLFQQHFERGYAEQVRRKRRATGLKASLIGAGVISAVVLGPALASGAKY